MKKTLLSTLLAAASLVTLAPFAHAEDGTITFNGTITAQTCTIASSGGGNDFTVQMPTVSASSLANAGATAGSTPFSIFLSNCTPDSGNVSTFFETNDSTIDTATGRLRNASGNATNVEVGLLNSDSSAIVLGAAEDSQNSQVVPINSGAATLNYYSQYVATGGAATAGSVNTTIRYSMNYQ